MTSPVPYGGRGPLMLIVTWTASCLAIILMGARLFVNVRVINAAIGTDFWWALSSLVLCLMAQVALSISVSYGVGNHATLLTSAQIVQGMQWSWIGLILTILSEGFGKLAIIAFLLRIQDKTHSKKGYFLLFVGWSNMIMNLVETTIILTACSPTQKLWDTGLPGTCDALRINQSAYFRGAWAAAGDLILAIYPVVFFWNLQISKRLKYGLCLLMSGGIITTACVLVKTVYVHLVTNVVDITYIFSTLVIWAYIYMWAVLILGCIPPIRPLFVRSLRLTSRNKRSDYSFQDESLNRMDNPTHRAGHELPIMSTDSIESILPQPKGKAGA